MNADLGLTAAERLLALYEEKGSKLSATEGFYLHLDPDIYDLELEVAESEAADHFYARLIDLFDSWLQEMTPEQRADFFTRNRLASDANTNWLLVGEERLRRYEEDLRWDEGQVRYIAPGRG